MAQSLVLTLADTAATAELGARLARAVLAVQPDTCVVFLEGELGAGKTTFARAFIQTLGHAGRVPSPTYTLVESYVVSGYRVYHLDLYRLRDPAELADLGLADLLEGRFLALVEWPEQGSGHLPPPDLVVRLGILPTGREAGLQCCTGVATALLTAMR